MSRTRPGWSATGRLLLAVVGLATLAVYGVAAFALYRFLLALWARRPAPLPTAVVVVGVSLALGYASYRLGTARIRAALDAVRLPRRRAPRLHDRVDALADQMGVASPAIRVAHVGMPNALALGGPSDGEVVLDVSLFRLLDARELEGIVAHELAHLAARDSLVKTLGYSLVRTVGGLLVVAVLPLAVLFIGLVRARSLLSGASPAETRLATRRAWAAVTGAATALLFVPLLVLQAYSRRREFAADARAAAATGRPLALARGLARIERAAPPRGPLSSLYIHGDEEGTLTRLLASHPPMEVRLARLRDLAAARSGERERTGPARRRD